MFPNRATRLASLLRRLLRSAPAIDAVAIVTLDGLPMVTAVDDDRDEEHLAAVTASLLALGEQAMQSFGGGRLAQLAIEGEHGMMFVLRAGEVALVAVTRPDASVGLVRFELREVAREIEALFAPRPSILRRIDGGTTHVGG
jgi:uncharacterized protein